MNLQYLEFDRSEDAEGVVCWDALAQPTAQHTPALLAEVNRLLAWAHRFDPHPGCLEEGAVWDFDLRIQQKATPLVTQWHSAAEVLVVSPMPNATEAMALSLSLSGTPAFAQAFAEHWDLS